MAAPARKAPTIYDVAARAGVSHQTVSRFLGGFEGIRPETREKVADSIAALKYTPNLSARMLATNTSHRVAALTSELVSAGPSQTMQGLASAARAAGYLLDIITIDVDSPDSVPEAVSLLRRQEFAGIVVIAVSDAVKDAVNGVDFGVPVYIDVGPADLPGSAGTTFNALGVTMAFEHLLSLGHRHVVHLAGPTAWLAARNRADSFREFVSRHALPAYPVLVGDWTTESGYGAVLAGNIDPNVTAIVSGNDQMALGAIDALYDLGFDVPSQISVTGFDDIAESAHFRPPLTTVRIDFQLQGTFLFNSLLAEIEQSATPESATFMHPELILRKSTAVPRRSN